MIAYLKEENRVLKELQGGKRILLNDDQRRRLAVKGKALGRKRLGAVGSLVTPDTILGSAGPSANTWLITTKSGITRAWAAA